MRVLTRSRAFIYILVRVKLASTSATESRNKMGKMIKNLYRLPFAAEKILRIRW